MRLLFPLLNSEKPFSPNDYSTQPYLRREAVATAISTFEEKRDRDKADSKSAVYTDITDWTCEWLTGTLLQGAYMREYHSWEREVKSFLNGQCHLNGECKALNWTGKAGFVAVMRKNLHQFSVALDEKTIAAIEIMRLRVNKMKHDAALSDLNPVSRGDYDTAAQAIADFWSQLMNQRIPVTMEWNEYVDKYFDETT